ncbi:MAG: radical SAM protein [Candidatus Omnitrophota bacterium]
MRLKCVLVNPVQLVHPPVGLLSVAAVLESNGCSVSVRELPSRHIVDFNASLADLMKYIENERPEMIGITCMAAQCGEVKEIVSALKAGRFSGKIVIGGVHPSFMTEEVMGWGPDYVVMDEGEETIAELAGAVSSGSDVSGIRGIAYKRADEIILNEKRGPVVDLDKLPLPAYHLLDKRRFTTRKGVIRGRWLKSGWIMTSRGCPSSCIFCSAHRMFGKKVRARGMDGIFREIALLVENYGIEAFVITDDTFVVKKDRVLDFCRRIKKEFPGLKWNCQARVNMFDDEIARALKDANCIQVDFGVESGSQRVLDGLRKGIRAEDTVRAFDACRAAGLRTLATLIIGNPGEEEEDLIKTKALIERIKPDFCLTYYATPFPGTELYRIAEGLGLMDAGDRYWHQYTEPVPMSNVDAKKLKKYLRDFTRLKITGNYLTNPLFLTDMAYFGVLNPGIAFRIFSKLAAGRVEEALFLITNSMYFKRQGQTA